MGYGFEWLSFLHPLDHKERVYFKREIVYDNDVNARVSQDDTASATVTGKRNFREAEPENETLFVGK